MVMDVIAWKNSIRKWLMKKRGIFSPLWLSF